MFSYRGIGVYKRHELWVELVGLLLEQRHIIAGGEAHNFQLVGERAHDIECLPTY